MGLSEHVPEKVPQRVINAVGKIMHSVADAAEEQEGRVIKCSSVALRGWAEAYTQLESSLAEAKQKAQDMEAMSIDAMDRYSNAVDKYTDEITQLAKSLAQTITERDAFILMYQMSVRPVDVPHEEVVKTHRIVNEYLKKQADEKS